MKSISKLILSLGIAFALSINSASAISVTRIEGRDRYETARKVNKVYFTGSNYGLAVIASGEDFRSALYGSQLASTLKIPFYINPNKGLSSKTVNELKKLGVKKVYVMGSKANLGTDVDNNLISIGIKVTRVYDDMTIDGEKLPLPFAVSEIIYNILHKGKYRGDISCNIPINDKKFPDLLSVIPLSAQLAREYQFYINGAYEITGYTGYNYIVGGYGSVPKEYIAGEYNGMGLYHGTWTDSEGKVHDYYNGRLAGTDRYKTAVEIAKAHKSLLNKTIKTAVIVDGTNYPDALASGIVGTFSDGAILLTKPQQLNQDTKNFIKNSTIENIIIVGGEKSVSKSVEKELMSVK